MRSILIPTVMVITSILTGCGGSTPDSTTREAVNLSADSASSSTAAVDNPPSYAQLLASPYAVMTNGKSVTLKATPYLNQQPAVLKTNGAACAIPTLIVPIELNATPAAALNNVAIDTVWLHANGKWWQGNIDSARSTHDTGRKNAFAQGCPDAAFQANENADVIVKLVEGQEVRYVRAAAVSLRSVE
ncbi:MAG: hypothetical protein ACK5NY_06765 [Burkholderiaceae bacterium]|jgi:hypothetical protein